MLMTHVSNLYCQWIKSDNICNMNEHCLYILYVSIITCLLMKLSETDVILKSITPKYRKIQQVTNRNTFSFIRKFLFEQIKHSTLTIYPNDIHFSMVHVHQLSRKSKRKLLREFGLRPVNYTFLRTDSLVINWVSGQTQISCYIVDDRIFLQHTFNIHPVFVINFTLQLLYSVDDCKRGDCKSTLSFKDHVGKYFNLHKFCGYIPSFSFYSESKKVILEIDVFPYTFITKSTFSVLDHRVVNNLNIPSEKENILILMFFLKLFQEISKDILYSSNKIKPNND